MTEPISLSITQDSVSVFKFALNSATVIGLQRSGTETNVFLGPFQTTYLSSPELALSFAKLSSSQLHKILDHPECKRANISDKIRLALRETLESRKVKQHQMINHMKKNYHQTKMGGL
jgi:hypothetical protein